MDQMGSIVTLDKPPVNNELQAIKVRPLTTTSMQSALAKPKRRFAFIVGGMDILEKSCGVLKTRFSTGKPIYSKQLTASCPTPITTV